MAKNGPVASISAGCISGKQLVCLYAGCAGAAQSDGTRNKADVTGARVRTNGARGGGE